MDAGISEKSLDTGLRSSLQQSVLAMLLVPCWPLEFWLLWRGFSATQPGGWYNVFHCILWILTAIRWLFFLEGYLTVFVGICGIFILPDFPSGPARWLTSAELSLARRRMEEDLRGHGPAEPKSSSGFSDLLSIITDWSVWLIAIACTCCYASLSFNLFFPTLVATMGYSPTISLLLCAPPWLVSAVTAIIVAR